MGFLSSIKNTVSRFLPNFWSKKEAPMPSLVPQKRAPIKVVNDFVWVDENEINENDAQERAYIESKLKNFSKTELLAHSRTGAYGAPSREEEATVDIANKEGQMIDYKIVPIQTISTGLVGEIFVPSNPTDDNHIYINWTGTHSLGTILADLEKAPGEESYRKEEYSILSQINDVVREYSQASDQKAKLVVTGHSLGGALAQNNIHSIQRAIATNAYEQARDAGNTDIASQWINAEKNFRKNIRKKSKKDTKDMPEHVRTHLSSEHVSSIKLGVWNAAGIHKAVSDSSNELAPILTAAGVKQKALFGMVAGDGVQQTGQGSVFSNVDKRDVKIDLIKMDAKAEEGFYKKLGLSPLGIAATTAGSLLLGAPLAIFGGLAVAFARFGISTGKAHTSKHFVTENGQMHDFKLYNNSTLEGRNIIEDKLNKKSSILQFRPLRIAQKGLYYAMNQFVPATKQELAQEQLNTPAIPQARLKT